MYRTCLFCNRDLGGNEVLETFPVGTRLAFDAHKGRLWVVCRKCERWNLSPLEERWEAIEAAERYFRDTRVRVSTENIGLARHPSGLELVRIGQPMRPEFAAWRYGDQFGRRRKRAFIVGGAVVVVAGTVVVAGAAAGIIGGTFFSQSGNLINLLVNGRTVVKLPLESGRVVKLKRPDLNGAELRPEPGGEWSLAVGRRKEQRFFYGEDARRVASIIMPAVNASGARAATVQEAVQGLEAAGGPEAFLADVEGMRNRAIPYRPAQVGKMDVRTRLALEMALHEEQERRALEGELKELELAWQAAEEIASISDDLLLPESARKLVSE